MGTQKISFGLLILSSVFYLGCFSSADYYKIENKTLQKELSTLLSQLNETDETPESRFIIIQQIIKVLHTAREWEKLNLFLTEYIQKNQSDPFNGYYLLTVALNYKDLESYPFAVHYFERILKNYPDLIVRGSSIHFICLRNLINLVDDPEVRVHYYREIIARFGDIIDRGQTFYYLARTYEELGEWDLSIQAYKSYLASTNTAIPGIPDAKKDVTAMILFFDRRDKGWIVEDLDQLVSQIKTAINYRDSRLLTRYRAKVNFFATSWEEEETEADIEFLADIGSFMRNRLYYSSSLEADSNNREAYLRTWGWSYRISTWYLYFRRINFPADPEIHGKWEWAGIYFGEKPFASSIAATTPVLGN